MMIIDIYECKMYIVVAVVTLTLWEIVSNNAMPSAITLPITDLVALKWCKRRSGTYSSTPLNSKFINKDMQMDKQP
jgi:hypothetical protein